MFASTSVGGVERATWFSAISFELCDTRQRRAPVGADHRYASIVVLTFEQMEALLGFALPASACTEPDWWTGEPVVTNRYSEAWIRAGRTAMPNFSARTVTFERT